MAIVRKLLGEDVQTVILDRHNYHTFQPLLYQVSTSGLEPDSIAYPMRKITRNSKKCLFRMAEVKSINPEKSLIETSIGDLIYDYLVIATGSKTNFFGNKSIEKNVDSKTFERLRSRIEYHNSLYEDVQPGDRYSLTYVPGKGTELSLNGEPKGLIEGGDFAAAVFSIWLGPKPISKSFKQQILGR